MRLENVLKISLLDVLKMSWRRLENVFQTFWRCLEDFFKTSWRCFEDVLKMSWWRLKDVLKTYGQYENIDLDQDFWRGLEGVFWRRKAKANISVLIKTSWRCLEDFFWRQRQKTPSIRLQDECLLGNFLAHLWDFAFTQSINIKITQNNNNWAFAHHVF